MRFSPSGSAWTLLDQIPYGSSQEAQYETVVVVVAVKCLDLVCISSRLSLRTDT